MAKGKRIVLTGPPCSGKTTLINLLRAKGYSIAREIAEEMIKEGFSDPVHRWQEWMLECWWRQDEMEEGFAHVEEVIFLDRGLYDNYAYLAANDRPMLDFRPSITGVRYDLALVLAPCPWRDNGVRYEKDGPAFQKKITPLLQRAYSEQGIRTIEIPLLPTPEERLTHIMSVVNSL